MSAVEALRLAHAAGIKLSVDENDLVLEAPSEPPSDILDTLRQHKTGIVELLRRGLWVRCSKWSAEDWLAYFAERAEIAEFDSGVSRAEAESRAFEWCLAEWLIRNSAYSSPDNCLGCGRGELPHDRLLPVGIGGTGRVWLHSRCQPAWYTGRKAEALAALAAMGITRRRLISPTISGKSGARDGRQRVGTAERLGARHGRGLPLY